MFRRIFAIALFAMFCRAAQADDLNNMAANFHSINPPRPMPPIVFEDEKGGQLSLSDFTGQYILLNIWATWCGPCVDEMPSLNALQAHFKDRNFVVLPLSEDREVAQVENFYQRHGLQALHVYMDHAGRLPALMHIHGLPTSILIDPQGREIGTVEGNADWDAPAARAFLDAKMGSGGTTAPPVTQPM